jgi:hypothetical protein
MHPQYWLVGTMFSGSDDHLDIFVKRGYWYCWDPRLNPNIPRAVADSFPKIKTGDRLAVKKMLGKGSPLIQIRALCIVTDIDYGEWRVYVRWLVTDMAREVPIKNCMGSIHGPFEPSDWRASIFHI